MKLFFDETRSHTHTSSLNHTIALSVAKRWRDRQGSKIKELVETLSELYRLDSQDSTQSSLCITIAL